MGKQKLKDFRAVIDLWSTKTLLAHRLSIKPNTVVRWSYTNSIPPHYWRSICAISRGRVHLDNLFDIAEAKAKTKPKINDKPARRQQEFAHA